jgi:hypothetical protein
MSADLSQSERSTYAAIGWIRRGDDGPSFGWES